MSLVNLASLGSLNFTKGVIDNGLSITAPSAVLFADGDQPYALTGAEKLAFSFSPSLYKGLEGAFDYYIDATNGNDGNAGTSEGAAWASLSQIDTSLLSGGSTVRVLVKSDTYDTADDYISVSTAPLNSNLEIVFEPGCVMDGAAVNAVTSTNGLEFNGANAFSTTVYGNGLIIQNYVDAGSGSPNAVGNRDSHTLYCYDVVADTCEDGFTPHGSAKMYLYDCTARNCVKTPFVAVDTSELYAYRTEFYGDSATLGVGAMQGSSAGVFEDCKFIPGSSGQVMAVANSTLTRCQVGTLSARFAVGTSAGAEFIDCFLNVSQDLNFAVTYTQCFGKISIRQRNGGSLTMENCVVSGPASGLSSIFYSNFDPGSGSPHYVHDNIFETATAAAFMSYDATNAGYVVAAGSEFFNNVLSGSAAFDADFVSADSGGTVIVDNVTDDALIGAANTRDPDDYGYAAGSPAIGAGVSGGNCGFAVGEVAAPNPQTGRVTVTLGIASGNLSLSQTTELTFTTGDGSADASMVFYGYVYYVLAALDGTEVDGLSSEQADISYSVLHDATGRTASETISVGSVAALTNTAINDSTAIGAVLDTVTSLPGATYSIINADQIYRPVISNIVAAETSDTTATIDLDIWMRETTAGTLWWYVGTSATRPSVTDLKAGTGAADSGNQAISNSGTSVAEAQTQIEVTGLSASTAYYVHVYCEDANGAETDIPSRQPDPVSFTTEASAGVTSADIIALSPWSFVTLEDLADVYVERSSPTTNVASDGDAVGTILDQSGNSRNAVASVADSERPIYDITAGIKSLEYDGTTNLQFGAGAGPSDCSIFFAVKTTDTTALLVGEQYNTCSDYCGYIQDGNTGALGANSGSFTVHVDNGSAQTNRDTFHDAVADGSWHIVELRNVNLSGYTNVFVGTYSGTGFAFTGSIGPDILIIETSAFDSADRDNTIVPYLQAGVGL